MSRSDLDTNGEPDPLLQEQPHKKQRLSSALFWDKGPVTQNYSYQMIADRENERAADKARKEANAASKNEKLRAAKVAAMDTVNELKEMVEKNGGEWKVDRSRASLSKKHLLAVFTIFDKPAPKTSLKDHSSDWVLEVKTLLGWNDSTKSFTTDTSQIIHNSKQVSNDNDDEEGSDTEIAGDD